MYKFWKYGEKLINPASICFIDKCGERASKLYLIGGNSLIIDNYCPEELVSLLRPFDQVEFEYGLNEERLTQKHVVRHYFEL